MKIKLGLLACAVAILVAACASTPSMEGGIVGTGDKPSCEDAKKKGGGAPVPEECR